MIRHPLYEKYLSDMKRLKATPPYMTEAQVLESLGIVVEDEYALPLHITPKKQPTIKTPTDKEVIDPKPKSAKKPKPKPKKLKKPKKERTDLSKMTPEEVRAHRSRLQRERMAKKRASGWVEPPRTQEQKERRNEYFKRYYAEKRNDPEFMAKRAKLEEKRKARRLAEMNLKA